MTSTTLKQQAHNLEPLLHIGKNGITDGVIAQLNEYLKRNNLVKVKILPSIIKEHSRKELAGLLESRTGSKVIQQVGFVVVLHKP